MSKNRRFLLILQFLTLLSFLANSAYSAYGTLDKVDINAPSSAVVNQQIQVQAEIHVSRSG
jgi:hypothetical protein